MPTAKNVIVFYTDQQRADSLGCMGNALARTPHLDALAARGTLYTRHYAANPVCMPSRCSFITGQYPQTHRVIDNGIYLPESALTMPEVFRRQGYRTASFGKLHFQTFKSYPGDNSRESSKRWASGELDDWSGPYYGFERVALTVGHGEGTGGAYGRWRARRFPDLKLGRENARGTRNFPQLGCYHSNLPVEAHHSTWVADQAVDFLDQAGDAPFYIHVSFPDPHHPYAAPTPYNTLFDDVAFPPPHALDGENDGKPEPYRRAMTGNPFPTDGGARRFDELTPEAYQQILAQTYAMVALIDDCIGRVLARLETLGLAQDTIVVFSADHGDFLGDHHFIQKGQLPCRSLLHIPLIVADPERSPGVVDAVGGNVDVMPTVLAACGVEIPAAVQGRLLPQPGQRPLRDYAFEAGWSKASPEYHHYTLYKQDWRISVFPNLRDGELYDLRQDPFEQRNLFHDPAHLARRQELLEELLFAVGAAEPVRPPTITDW